MEIIGTASATAASISHGLRKQGRVKQLEGSMGDRAWAGTQARPGKGKVLSGDTLASMRTNFPVSFPVFPNPSLSLAPSAPKCPPTPVGVPVSH